MSYTCADKKMSYPCEKHIRQNSYHHSQLPRPGLFLPPSLFRIELSCYQRKKNDLSFQSFTIASSSIFGLYFVAPQSPLNILEVFHGRVPYFLSFLIHAVISSLFFLPLHYYVLGLLSHSFISEGLSLI